MVATAEGGGIAEAEGPGAAPRIDGCATPADPEQRDRSAPLSTRALASLRASGLTALNLTLAAAGDSWEDTLRYAASADGWIESHPELLLRIRSAADLRRARQGRRVGLVYGLQDLEMIGEDFSLRRLDALFELGVRIVQPTYNRRGAFGSGCLEPEDHGLTRLGQAALERLHRLRILVDLSHCGPRTSAQALAAAGRPVAITHAGCAAVHPHPRNKGDDLLRACAERGGVVGIYFMPYLRARGQPMADDVLRHLEHALRICGQDGVGVGTDGAVAAVEDGPEYRQAHRREVLERRAAGIAAPGEEQDVFTFVPDLNVPRRLEVLGGLLRSRGHSAAVVDKVLGGNFARLFSEVWGG